MQLKLEEKDEKQEKIESTLDNLKLQRAKGWGNFCGTYFLPKAEVANVKKVKGLVQLAESFNDLKIVWRVAAGDVNEKYSHTYTLTNPDRYRKSYSLTPWPAGSDVILHLTGKYFNHYQIIDTEKKIASVGPSVMVGTLDDKLAADELMLMNQASLIRVVTNSGLAAVGGHGAGLKSESYAHNAESYEVMLYNGKRIIFNEEHPLFQLLGPNHLGLIGVVLDTRYKCRSLVKLRQRKIPMSLPEFLEKAESLIGSTDHFSYMYVPTGPDDLTNYDIKNVAVFLMDEVDINTPDQNLHLLERNIEQYLEINIQQGSHITDLFPFLPAEAISDYMKHAVLPFAIGTKEVVIVGPFSKVYHYQVEYPPRINDFALGFARSPDAHEVIEVTTKVAKMHQRAIAKGKHPVSYAVYGRALKGTEENDQNQGISMTACPPGKESFEVDVVSSPEAPGFKEFRRKTIRFTNKKFGGRLHLGKFLPLDGSVDLLKMFPGLKNYRKGLEDLHIENDLDFKKSPFLTDFYRAFLYPDEGHKFILPEMSPPPLHEICRLAKHHLVEIEEKYEQAVMLIQHLQKLASPPMAKFLAASMLHAVGPKSEIWQDPSHDNQWREGFCCLS